MILKLLRDAFIDTNRYLSWDIPQELMVVKSAQNKLPAAARQVSLLKNSVILKFLQN